MRFDLRALCVGLIASAAFNGVAGAETAKPAFSVPPNSALPSGPLGDKIRRGQAIFIDPGKNAPAYVGNTLKCSNCHLDAGRVANAAPLGPAYVMYPAFRKKDGQVDTFAERLRQCFRYSMNGKEPPLGGDVLVALESYAFFLARGEPVGTEVDGRGYPKLAKAAQGLNYARGAAVYAGKCAACHGADGAGQMAGSQTTIPPLWGASSYNWGAGMTSVANAAGFIKANMPLGQGGSLSDQEAWDVAMFVDGHERPQDPRFTGDVAETRKRFHDTPMSLYGQTVNGVLLGQASPPAGPKGQ